MSATRLDLPLPNSRYLFTPFSGPFCLPHTHLQPEVRKAHYGETTQLLPQWRLGSSDEDEARGSFGKTVIDTLFIQDVLIQSQLHNQTNAMVNSPASTTSNDTASDAALSITEILEKILSYLSVEDLILLRRVSRHWRDVMAGSLVLQRAMFLAPEPVLPFEWHLQGMSFDKPWLYIRQPSGTAREPGERVMQSSRFNPLLFEKRLDVESQGVSYGGRSVQLHAHNDIFTASGTNLFTQMFIAQPPVTSVHVGSGARQIELYNRNGVRVADFIEALGKDYGYPHGLRKNVLSIVVPGVMFPSTGEEKQALIVRSHRPLRAR